MSAVPTYPVRAEAMLDPPLSRCRWLANSFRIDLGGDGPDRGATHPIGPAPAAARTP